MVRPPPARGILPAPNGENRTAGGSELRRRGPPGQKRPQRGPGRAREGRAGQGWAPQEPMRDGRRTLGASPTRGRLAAAAAPPCAELPTSGFLRARPSCSCGSNLPGPLRLHRMLAASNSLHTYNRQTDAPPIPSACLSWHPPTHTHPRALVPFCIQGALGRLRQVGWPHPVHIKRAAGGHAPPGECILALQPIVECRSGNERPLVTLPLPSAVRRARRRGSPPGSVRPVAC